MVGAAIVKGSIANIARQTGKSLAESFMSCDVIVIVDVSSSMGARDSRGGQSRYDVACCELAKLQENLPGKIAVTAFSQHAEFCPSGVPVFMGGGTDMAKALDFARVADVEGMRFILVSDGEPNDERETVTAARKYTNRIDTIYVGPEDNHAARQFLDKLAHESGGKGMSIDHKTMELESGVRYLLT